MNADHAIREPRDATADDDTLALAGLDRRMDAAEERREARPRRGRAGLRFSERTREAVLDAAGEILVTRGILAMTLDSVARAANVEARMLARWWPSEEALMLDALRHEWLTLAVRMRRGGRLGLRLEAPPRRCNRVNAQQVGLLADAPHGPTDDDGPHR